MDCSLSGSSNHGILQARILEWVAMPSSRGSSRPRDRTCVSCSSCTAGRFFTAKPLGKPSDAPFSSVQSLSHVWLFETLWTAAPQASLSITNSQSLLKLMSIELVMPSNHLIPFSSCLQSFPASKSFQMNKFFTSGGQSIGVSASDKGEKERYTHLNAEFQRIAGRDKKGFLSDQCKEIEENNRIMQRNRRKQ